MKLKENELKHIDLVLHVVFGGGCGGDNWQLM